MAGKKNSARTKAKNPAPDAGSVKKNERNKNTPPDAGVAAQTVSAGKKRTKNAAASAPASDAKQKEKVTATRETPVAGTTPARESAPQATAGTPVESKPPSESGKVAASLQIHKEVAEDTAPPKVTAPESQADTSAESQGGHLEPKPGVRMESDKAGSKAEKTANQRHMAGPRLPGGISPRPVPAGNPYLPRMATVLEIIEETPAIRTLRLVLDEQTKADFNFEPGQVAQISVFGAGEATFVINSPPSEKNYLQFSVMRTGEVTDAIHRLHEGDRVGLRAPLGNFFPYADWKGKNVFLIGGGIGMAPIRVIMLYLLEHKKDYGKISLLYGARGPKDMAYSYELDAWKHNPDLDCTLCIDNPAENWTHKVGLIPTVLEELKPSPENAVAVLCGPPVMIRFTLETLRKLGFGPENIVTTLEKRMKCGIGICGRCNIGDRYVCVDGPVFTMKELENLPPDL